MDATAGPRVVLVHDWLTGMRGGEKCLEVLCRRWPQARLYTLLHRPGSVAEAIERLRPTTSLLGRLPGAHRYYRHLLPLMPAAVAAWRLPPCDLVVSFSHCVAKAARPPRGVPHVCYCFTPMRYAWHMRQVYFGPDRVRGLRAWLLGRLLAGLRRWDRRTAARVRHFLAISRTVQARIKECYGRDSTVLYPPVDTDFYCPASVPRNGPYLVVSAFAPYKRLDLAVQACNCLRRELVVIGDGQDGARLRALAGPTVHFLGWQPDAVIRDHLRRCRALLFPGEEDFGIVPVEAQACGAPVIAFGRGGATETVVPIADCGLRIADWSLNPQSAIGCADGLVVRRADRRGADGRTDAVRGPRRRVRPRRRPPAGRSLRRPSLCRGAVRLSRRCPPHFHRPCPPGRVTAPPAAEQQLAPSLPPPCSPFFPSFLSSLPLLPLKSPKTGRAAPSRQEIPDWALCLLEFPHYVNYPFYRLSGLVCERRKKKQAQQLLLLRCRGLGPERFGRKAEVEQGFALAFLVQVGSLLAM